MPFDNFVVGAVAHELNLCLGGGKIEKIHQPERDELILHVNVPPNAHSEARRHCDLYLSVNSNRPVLCLTKLRSGNPQNPPGFCMLLRKHLMNGRITCVRQVHDERVVCIDINTTNELGLSQRRILVFEAMGKHSNIILLESAQDVSREFDFPQRVTDVDIDGNLTHGELMPNRRHPERSERYSTSDFPQGRVTDCIKRIYENQSRERQMFPGETYIPPPPGKGISPVMEAETELTQKTREYYAALAAERAYSPQIYEDETGMPKDFHVFPLEIYAGLHARPAPSVSEMIEDFYERRESAGRLKQMASDLNQALKTRLDKLYLKQQRLLEDLARAEGADAYRVRGELITANIHLIRKGLSEVQLTDYASITPENPDGDQVRVTLDPLLSPSQNAQRYFKKYNKEKTGFAHKQEQLRQTKEEITFLESYQVFLENAGDGAQIDELREELCELGYAKQRKHAARPKNQRPAYLEYQSSSGLRIRVGRNNRENDELSLKKSQADELWLHTKDIPGSHVILSGDEQTRDEQSIREAAQIAAYYSKGRASSNVPVDYTLIKYVKKPSGAKPGMVIFTHNRTLYVEPKIPE